jgi:hypothetical protein
LKNASGLKCHQSSAHSHSFTHPGSQCTQCASVEEIEDEEALRCTNNELWELKHGLIWDYREMLTGKSIVMLQHQLVSDENLYPQVVFVMRMATFSILVLLHHTQQKVLMTGLRIATD